MNKEKTNRVLEYFNELFPDAYCELNHETDFQLLVAVMLSAQTTDKKVNQLTESLFKKYPEVNIIHFDAHTDLREEFLGRKLSHATVLRKCYDLLGDGRIYQFGIRSGDSSEFKWAAEGHTHLRKFDLVGLDECIKALKDKPVYITIDLDVLDPSIFPGTGTPEAGGITYKELQQAILDMRGLNNIVGADIVELSPHYDPSMVSSQVACKVLREMVLLLHYHD